MSRQKSRCSSSGSNEGAMFGSASRFDDAGVDSKFGFRGRTRMPFVESCILGATRLLGVENRKLGRGRRSSGSVWVGVSRRSKTLNRTWALTGSAI